MRHLAHHVALAASLAVTGSIAHADADADDDIDIVEVHEEADPPPRAKPWHVEIGPYLWASSVDANVSLGPTSIGSGIDFTQLQHHARYGAEVLAAAHYGRFAIYGDLMYGVVGIDGGTSVGPLMVTLDGTASSLLVEGAGGYLLAGDDKSRVSLEARGGVRYQRTAIAGSIGIAGSTITPPAQIDAGADALAGARAVVRPSHRFSLASSFDIGLFGASTSTWSAAIDGSMQLTSHLLLSLGWRTLTMDRAHVDIVMHGPRAALQVTF